MKIKKFTMSSNKLNFAGAASHQESNEEEEEEEIAECQQNQQNCSICLKFISHGQPSESNIKCNECLQKNGICSFRIPISNGE